MDFKQHMLSLPDKNLLHFIFIFKSGKKNRKILWVLWLILLLLISRAQTGGRNNRNRW